MKFLNKFHNYPEFEEYSHLINQLNTEDSPRIVIVDRSLHPINESGKKLGVFSGSFNPITIAHIKMFEEAQVHFELDEILLLLAKANVDKDEFGIPLSGRVLTLKRYADEGNNVSIGLSSHGRYIDKISALKEIYPEGTEYHFIIGYDTLVRIFDPKYYTDIDKELKALFSQCKFIVANRDNVDIETIKQFLDVPKIRSYSSHISCLMLPRCYADVSSTEVRKRLEDGKSISHLVPSVLENFFA